MNYPLATASGSVSSHDRPIRNQSIFWNNYDSISNEVAPVWSVRIIDAGLVQKFHIRADARVFVDDRAANGRAFTDANPGPAAGSILLHVFQSLVKIRPHNVGRFDLSAFGEAAAQADQRAADLGAVDDAAVADDRIANLAIIDL